jgi:1-acyl-sn-glycerol-3-phosphate acyltransferase
VGRPRPVSLAFRTNSAVGEPITCALRKNVPIVPMVTLGGQETALFLSRGERLARLTGARRLMRLKTIPVVVGFPFGLSVAGFPPLLPLPAKVTT